MTVDEELEELRALFALQETRMTEAIEAWRVAHPGHDNVIPDLGKLLVWLLSERKGVGKCPTPDTCLFYERCIANFPLADDE